MERCPSASKVSKLMDVTFLAEFGDTTRLAAVTLAATRSPLGT